MVKLPELTADEQLVEIEIVGRAPGLIMHNVKSMLEAVSGTRKGECKHEVSMDSPCEKCLESMTYRDENGNLCLTSVALYSCMVRASTDFKPEGGGRKSMATVLPGAMRIEPANITLLTSDGGKPIRTYEVRADHVVVNRARVLRFRPWVQEWKAKWYMIYNARIVGVNVLKDILVAAGLRVGLLDWRPQKRGPYGTFTVSKFEEAV